MKNSVVMVLCVITVRGFPMWVTLLVIILKTKLKFCLLLWKSKEASLSLDLIFLCLIFVYGQAATYFLHNNFSSANLNMTLIAKRCLTRTFTSLISAILSVLVGEVLECFSTTGFLSLYCLWFTVTETCCFSICWLPIGAKIVCIVIWLNFITSAVFRS